VSGERGSRIGNGTGSTVLGSKRLSDVLIRLDECVVKSTIETVDIFHHASCAVEDVKVVTEQFLGPAADLVNWSVILEDFAHSATIAEPIEGIAPKELPVLADAPAAAGSFTDDWHRSGQDRESW
jgi:hypothetical protein